MNDLFNICGIMEWAVNDFNWLVFSIPRRCVVQSMYKISTDSQIARRFQKLFIVEEILGRLSGRGDKSRRSSFPRLIYEPWFLPPTLPSSRFVVQNPCLSIFLRGASASTTSDKLFRLDGGLICVRGWLER